MKLEHLYDHLKRHRTATWVALGLIVVACVCLSLRLNYREDIAEFLPADPQNARYTSVYNQLADQGEITVIFRLDSNEDADLLKDAIDRFADEWQNTPYTDTLQPLLRATTDDDMVFDALDLLRHNVAVFLTEADIARIDSLLNEQGYIDQSVANVRRMMAYPMSGLATDAVLNDPLNLYPGVLQRLQDLQPSSQYTAEDGYLLSSDGTLGYAFITTPYTSSDTRGNGILSKHIEDVINKCNTPGVSISAVGAPLIAATNAGQIKRDSILSLVVAVVLIVALLVYATSYKRNLLYLLLAIGFGWLFALAIISLLSPSVSIIVIGIGSVLIGIAVNYPLHYIDHIRDEASPRLAIAEMKEPLIVGNITTVSAFACLLLMDAKAMRDLGLFGALMLVGTIVFTMIFLPLMAKSGRKKAKGSLDVEWSAPHFNLQHSKWVALAVLLATVVLGYYSLHTSFDSDLHHINYMTQQQSADLELLSSSLTDTNQPCMLYVVAEAPTLDEAMQHNQQLQAVLAEQLDSKSTIASASHLLPSSTLQQSRIAAWNDLHLRHPHLEDDLRAAALANGFSSNAFDGFIDLWNRTYSPLDSNAYATLRVLGSHYILPSDTSTRLLSIVRTDSAGAARTKAALLDATDNNTHTGFVFDPSDISSNLVNTLSDNFNYLLYICSFVVFAFLWLSFGSLELSIVSFLPMAMGWLWILGIMQICGIQFNIVNIILATFIFGQGDDYTIFITEGLVYENAYGHRRLARYRRSVVLSALLMFIGIGSLILAKHPAMRSLAEVAMVGMAVVVLMACYVPPLCYRWLTHRRGSKRVIPVTLTSMVGSTYCFVMLVLACIIFQLVMPLLWLVPMNADRRRLIYHRMLQRLARYGLKLLPRARAHFEGQLSDKPSVIVANHLSSLDLLCIIALSPKLVIMTKRWVWNNPLYGLAIRLAEYYPSTWGYDRSLPKLQSLIKRGYSIVVFPEGTRSEDGRLQRFHKGAFQLAADLGVGVQLVHLHGTSHVMPKHSYYFSPGQITIRVTTYIPHERLAPLGTRGATRLVHRLFRLQQRALQREKQTVDYFRYVVALQYRYRGRDVERRCRRIMRSTTASALLSNLPSSGVIHWNDPCQGEQSLLLALAFPTRQVEATFQSPHDYLLAANCALHPHNLTLIPPDFQQVDSPSNHSDLKTTQP